MIVNDAKAAIADTWEALVPLDRPHLPYRRVAGKRTAGAHSSDARLFGFDPPEMREILNRNDGYILVAWVFQAAVLVDGTGRNWDEFGSAVAREQLHLAVALERKTDWPTGVRSVRVVSAAPAEAEGGQDTLILFELEATCYEPLTPEN